MITKEMAISMYSEIISSVCHKLRHDISSRFSYKLTEEKFEKSINEWRYFIILHISYNGEFLSNFNIPMDVDMERYYIWKLPEELIYVLAHRKFVIMKCELRKKL